MKKYTDYVDLAQLMTQGQGDRDTQDTEQENMYALKSSDLPAESWTKETLSPDVRNAIQSGAKMLSASDPKWSIPFSSPDQKAMADEWELLADRIWKGAGAVAGKKIHFDMGLSAMVYGRINLRTKLVSDLLTLAKGNAIRTARLMQIQNRTPALFDVPNPRSCFALKDETGLIAHLVKRKVRMSEIQMVSKISEQQTGGMNPTDRLIVYDLYDEEQHVTWIEGQGEPFIMLPIEGGVMPVAYADVEGSDLFSLNDNVPAVQPFAYGVAKSNLWKRKNLALTVFYSLFFAIGANPLFTFNGPDTIDLTPDYSIPGGVIRTGPNGRMDQLMKQVFTTDFQQAVGMADQMITESTMYKTVMGENPGSGSPYSLAALLSTNGRQTLIPYERMLEHCCSQGMQTAFLMLKSNKSKLTWTQQGEKKELKVDDIPDDIAIEAKLSIELPVDESKNAQMALQLVSGDHPLSSHAFVREKFLDISQSTLMDKEILRERVAFGKGSMQSQIELQKLQFMAQQEMQQAQMAAQQATQPTPGGPPAGGPPQPPPEMQQPQGPPMGPGEPGPGGQMPPELQALMAQQQQDQNMGQPAPGQPMGG